jgi:hypothetical protein
MWLKGSEKGHLSGGKKVHYVTKKTLMDYAVLRGVGKGAVKKAVARGILDCDDIKSIYEYCYRVRKDVK